MIVKNYLLDNNYRCLCTNDTRAALGAPDALSIIDLADGTYKQKIPGPNVSCLKWNSDGYLLYNDGKKLCIRKDREATWTNDLHLRNVTDVSWRDTDVFSSGATDSQVFAWDRRQPNPSIVFNAPKGVSCYCLAWSPSSSHLLASSHDNAIKIWDARLPRKSLSTVKSAHTGRISSMEWSAEDNSLLLTADLLSSIKLWNVNGQQVLPVHQHVALSPIVKARFSPTSDLIVYALNQRENNLHKLHSEFRYLGSLTTPKSHILDIEWHFSSLLTLSADRSLCFWSIGEEDSSAPSLAQFAGRDLHLDMESFENYETEITYLRDNLQSPDVKLEEVNMAQRLCIVKLSNDDQFIRILAEFPIDYPTHAASYSFLAVSLISQHELKSFFQTIETKGRLVETIMEISQKLLRSAPVAEDSDMSYEASEEHSMTDMRDNDLLSTISVSLCGHCWHPQGNLYQYEAVGMPDSKQDPFETDDFFDDIKSDLHLK
jgi:WD40 repeat protein